MDDLNITQLETLQSKDQAALLDTVDEIRRHGVNRFISLPQLIVCGDQSSGKSSVLEAISGVHFPVNDGLCTRFTTEVILRRSSDKVASVKVIPAADATREHREKLSQFEKRSVGHGQIPALISEAKAIMGLTGSSTFSRDVLQLEVSDPKLPHLTLVDLPGLIHHPNKEQTEEDVKIPKELVKKYMSQPRSIVLAVVTAKNDTSNQVVLEFAKTVDPQGSRTMGIITKPDCLIKDSPNESTFFALASNKETYLNLDWHVLRNADYGERKSPDFCRDEVEREFFASGIWKNLPPSKRGVKSLRSRLSHILFQQIQKELPSLLTEIENELKVCKTTLERLGPPRDTPASRRMYLTGMADRFHDLVRAGNQGNYQDPFFKIKDTPLGFFSPPEASDSKPNTRLRANLRREELHFAEEMQRRGHTHKIVAVPEKPSLFGGPPDPRQITEERFLQETRVLLDQSKGRELPGTFTPLLVGELFVRQSQNWKPIALKFVTDAWTIVKKFLDDVLSQVADETVRRAVLEEIIDPAMDLRLLALRDKVDEVFSPYASGYPSTLNRRFLNEINLQRNIRTKASTDMSGGGLFGLPDSHACRELLHLMQAYYAVALDVFVDNVASLAVENCLMRDLKDLLSPLKISQMDDKELELIALESVEVRELRSETVEKQTALQRSYDVCRRQKKKIASTRLNEGPNGNNSYRGATEGVKEAGLFSGFLKEPKEQKSISGQGFGRGTGAERPDVLSGKPSSGHSSTPGFSSGVSLFGKGSSAALTNAPPSLSPFGSVSEKGRGRSTEDIRTSVNLQDIKYEKDGEDHVRHISSADHFCAYSPEEIRLNDYSILEQMANVHI